MMLNAIAAFLNSPIVKIKEIYFVISSVCTLYGGAVKLGGTSIVKIKEIYFVISSVCTNFVQKITTDEFIRYYWQIEKPLSIGQPLRYGTGGTGIGDRGEVRP